MTFTDDLVTIFVAAGIPDTDIFVGAKAALPEGPGPFITIKETPGSPPEGTHNSTDIPAYVRPSAQIMARGEEYTAARLLAQQAYDALFPIRNQFINGTWWRQVTMKQEPFDLAEDEKGRPRIVFNIDVVKRPRSTS